MNYSFRSSFKNFTTTNNNNFKSFFKSSSFNNSKYQFKYSANNIGFMRNYMLSNIHIHQIICIVNSYSIFKTNHTQIGSNETVPIVNVRGLLMSLFCIESSMLFNSFEKMIRTSKFWYKL